jgi:hypothetical protein
MGLIIAEPSLNTANLTEWQKIITKLTQTTGGLALVYLTNMDNNDEPRIMAGSRVEVNGTFYKSQLDEQIAGTPANGLNYIYCVPNEDFCTYEYSATPPVYDTAKGGFFNGNKRAVASFVYFDGNFYNKKILAISDRKIITDLSIYNVNLTLADNATYNFGTLANLIIAYPAGYFECEINFFSGSTKTVISYPAETVWAGGNEPVADSIETNKNYYLSFQFDGDKVRGRFQEFE